MYITSERYFILPPYTADKEDLSPDLLFYSEDVTEEDVLVWCDDTSFFDPVVLATLLGKHLFGGDVVFEVVETLVDFDSNDFFLFDDTDM